MDLLIYRVRGDGKTKQQIETEAERIAGQLMFYVLFLLPAARPTGKVDVEELLGPKAQEIIRGLNAQRLIREDASGAKLSAPPLRASRQRAFR